MTAVVVVMYDDSNDNNNLLEPTRPFPLGKDILTNPFSCSSPPPCFSLFWDGHNRNNNTSRTPDSLDRSNWIRLPTHNVLNPLRSVCYHVEKRMMDGVVLTKMGVEDGRVNFKSTNAGTFGNTTNMLSSKQSKSKSTEDTHSPPRYHGRRQQARQEAI